MMFGTRLGFVSSRFHKGRINDPLVMKYCEGVSDL